MTSRSQLPIVALVGRPNVGKSTLFNRLAGRRRALVEGRPGVTRDRIAEEVEVGGRRVLLVDTAGLDPQPGADLARAIQAQARSAVAEADAILLVLDGQAGLLPGDEALARELRRTARPVLAVVNKIDVAGHADRTADFERLGLPRLRAISAEHGAGAWDAFEELVAELAPQADASAGDDAPAGEEGSQPEAVRLALVGRPNVGKSSLANRLIGAERLVVADEPGTTRDAVDTWIEGPAGRFVLIDTAGLRKPGRRRDALERGSALMAVRAIERADVVLVVVDAALGFTDQDAHIASLVRQRGRAAAVLANKWDRVGEEGRGPEGTSRQQVLEAITHGLRFMPDTPVVKVSAKSGLHMDRILPLALRLHETAARRIATPDLNRWLQEAVSRHEPAMAQRGARRRPVKFFYATQTGVSPPTFVLFCSGASTVAPNYRRYLEKGLRTRFGLAGTPVRLRLRERRRPARAES